MKTAWMLSALVLLLAGALQVMRVSTGINGNSAEKELRIGLGGLLPKLILGWDVSDEPLGQTDFMQTTVEKTLNFDDMVNRVYRKGAHSFGLYVAYWSPNRMPVQKVAAHTPDRCWSANGWTCEAMRVNDQIKAGDRHLLPARWRLFRPPTSSGTKQYVLYWHLVGGELYDSGEGFNQWPNPIKWCRDTLSNAVKGSSDQYFVRLMSTLPFEDLQGDPGFQKILLALSELGLAVAPTKLGR